LGGHASIEDTVRKWNEYIPLGHESFPTGCRASMQVESWYTIGYIDIVRIGDRFRPVL